MPSIVNLVLFAEKKKKEKTERQTSERGTKILL